MVGESATLASGFVSEPVLLNTTDLILFSFFLLFRNGDDWAFFGRIDFYFAQTSKKTHDYTSSQEYP